MKDLKEILREELDYLKTNIDRLQKSLTLLGVVDSQEDTTDEVYERMYLQLSAMLLYEYHLEERIKLLKFETEN